MTNPTIDRLWVAGQAEQDQHLELASRMLQKHGGILSSLMRIVVSDDTENLVGADPTELRVLLLWARIGMFEAMKAEAGRT